MEDKTLKNFCYELASSSPTPGGGGASALVGAIAISLGKMVGSLTVGKKNYANVEDEIKNLNQRATLLIDELLNDIELDAKAFEPLSKAYSIPKDDPTRDQKLEDCLKQAASAPVQILKNITESIDLIERYAQIGSKMLLSDAASASIVAHGALLAAQINIKVNTRLMKDRNFALELNRKTNDIVEIYANKALSIYHQINEGMN